jgi:hypothetical protein
MLFEQLPVLTAQSSLVDVEDNHGRGSERIAQGEHVGEVNGPPESKRFGSQ